MQLKLDTHAICHSPPQKLATYLQKQHFKHPELEVAAALFHLIQIEAIPPSIFSIWLSICKSPSVLRDALQQEYSIRVRRTAIKHFGKALRTDRWKETWDGIGGTDGIVRLLASFSVEDVRMFAQRVGTSIRGQRDISEKRQHITSLVYALVPSLRESNGSSSSHSPITRLDARDLFEQYSSLLVGCDPALVRRVVFDAGSELPVRNSKTMLVLQHHSVFRDDCMESVLERTSQAGIHEHLPRFLQNTPPEQDRKAGFSASMDFSVEVLQRLIDSKKPAQNGFDEDFVFSYLIEPLLRRVIKKKKVDWESRKEVIDLLVTYIAAEPDAAQSMRLHRDEGGLVYETARCWSKRPDLFQATFERLLQVAPLKDRKMTFRRLVRVVPVSKRWTLLRMLFANRMSLASNIENDGDLRQLCIQDEMYQCWPTDLFLSLPRREAVLLLNRLCKILPAESMLEKSFGITILSFGMNMDSSYLDPVMLRLELDDDLSAADRLEIARGEVESHKSRAATSREPSHRAYFAKGAFCWAIVSRSISLYAETILWARRFLKDPLAVKELFFHSVIASPQSVRLLSGIPDPLPVGTTIDDVAADAKEGNEIVWSLFETVCLALGEPSFYAPDWSTPLTLIQRVVVTRMRQTERVQQHLALSDEKVYTALWADTLDLLLRIERTALDPAYEKLNFNRPAGPLEGSRGLYEGKNAPIVDTRVGFMFVEALYKARNDVWLKYRLAQEPAVTSLPKGFPRGLPIQAGTCFFKLDDMLPQFPDSIFVQRAKSVVFAEPGVVLVPLRVEEKLEDVELKDVIGPFVDSYKAALRILLHAQAHSESRNAVMLGAWNHAITQLSEDRMNRYEAEEFWRPYFKRVWSEFEPPIEKRHEPDYHNRPMLPTDFDSENVVEWDPAENYEPPPSVEKRDLQPTLLDCNLYADEQFKAVVFLTPRFHIQGFDPPCFTAWDGSNNDPSTREAEVASALLYLDTKISGPRRLLTSAFPSKNDMRYPAMFLSESFLSRKDISTEQALGVLERDISTVPVSLLKNITDKAWFELSQVSEGDRNLAMMRRLAYGLIRLLSLSERPTVATESILKVVLEHQDASSWHRQLLSLKFLRKIPAADAEAVGSSFAAAIVEKIQQQQRTRKLDQDRTSEGDSVSVSSSRPYVKVTTVKYLAQMLDGANYVSPNFAASILPELFKNSSHPDIRIAVLESLVNMLCRCPDVDDPLAAQILIHLQEVIPIIGALDENNPTPEGGWKEVEVSGKLPQVYEPSTSLGHGLDQIRQTSPMYGVFATAAHAHKTWAQPIVEKILLPTIKLSIEQNRKWLLVYLRSQDINPADISLPIPPVKLLALQQLIERHPSLTPDWVLELHHRIVMLTMKTPQVITDLNRRLKEKTNNADKHWLSLFTPPSYRQSFWNYLPSFLYDVQSFAGTDPDKRSHKSDMIQRFIYERADALLKSEEHDRPDFALFMNTLNVPLSRKDEDLITWTSYLKPVVTRILDHIESLRTPEWQRNPRRKPSVLPPVLQYRLWLLPYRQVEIQQQQQQQDGSAFPIEERCKIFASELRRHIEKIVASGLPYHDDVRLVEEATLRNPNTCHAYVALELGEVRRTMGLAECLCVELAAKLVKAATMDKKGKGQNDHDDNGKNAETIRDIRNMLQSWTSSTTSEWLRMKGLELTASILAFEDQTFAKLVIRSKEKTWPEIDVDNDDEGAKVEYLGE